MKPKKLKLKEMLLLYSKIRFLLSTAQDIDDLIVAIQLAGLGEEVYRILYKEPFPNDLLDQHFYISLGLEDNNFGAFIFFVSEITDGR